MSGTRPGYQRFVEAVIGERYLALSSDCHWQHRFDEVRVPRKKHPSEEGNPEQSGSILDRDGLINSEELAGFLGETVEMLDGWACRGGGPPFHKVGKHRKYLPADVKDWMREVRRDVQRKPAA
jgi:hypothetical protein